MHGFASAEKPIAAAFGGTLGEARMLVDAGLAALADDEAEDPGGDDPGDDGDDDDDLLSETGVAVNHTTGTTMVAGDVRRWRAQAGIIPMVMGGASLPLDVGRAERLATPAQRRALTVRDGGCVWCDAPPAWCDAHHLTAWADGGSTDLENLVLLCRSCHTRVHGTGWRVEREAGRTVIVPSPGEVGDAGPIPSARERTEGADRRREERPSDGPDAGGGAPPGLF